MKISKISAHEILASGGYPTVEAEVTLDNGTVAKASVPYGASAGSHEATVLNDGDNSRYLGKGVQKAVENVNERIAPVLEGLVADDQKMIDQKMLEIDGTDNKSNLGGNAILAVSLAVAKAVAKSKDLELYEYIQEQFDIEVSGNLPNPMIVVIEGGKHAHDTTDLQEYCLLGMSDKGATENIRMCLEAYHELKKILKAEGLSVNVGNEGAFAPNGISNNEAPFNYLVKAIENAGYVPGEDIGIAIDAAASEFYEDGKYNLSVEDRKLTSEELMQYYETWFQKYPIITVEDMFDEDDWDAWVEFTRMCKEHNVENIGDDITVTNVKRLQKAIDMNAITAILIKLNQIGSLTETVETCKLARQHNMMTVPSHRGGGETNDTSMVDLAAAVGSGYIKVGPTRGERVSKYNRLMEIEREMR